MTCSNGSCYYCHVGDWGVATISTFAPSATFIAPCLAPAPDFDLPPPCHTLASFCRPLAIDVCLVDIWLPRLCQPIAVRAFVVAIGPPPYCRGIPSFSRHICSLFVVPSPSLYRRIPRLLPPPMLYLPIQPLAIPLPRHCRAFDIA